MATENNDITASLPVLPACVCWSLGGIPGEFSRAASSKDALGSWPHCARVPLTPICNVAAGKTQDTSADKWRIGERSTGMSPSIRAAAYDSPIGQADHASHQSHGWRQCLSSAPELLRHFCGWLVSEGGSHEQLADDCQSVVGWKSKVTVLRRCVALAKRSLGRRAPKSPSTLLITCPIVKQPEGDLYTDCSALTYGVHHEEARTKPGRTGKSRAIGVSRNGQAGPFEFSAGGDADCAPGAKVSAGRGHVSRPRESARESRWRRKWAKGCGKDGRRRGATHRGFI